ncbi:MAG: DNA primase [Bergeyella sp.]|nr:DNA primase [Bergeyella sp.]
MISRETIDKIFSSIRIEDIVGEYVSLKRVGSNLKGLSPFQEEKSPSFVVSPSKQIWKDFSSGKGGTAISFLMEIEGFTYPEALRYVAKKYAIEIEEDKKEISQQERALHSRKGLLYKIHEVACNFFQEVLWNSEEGEHIAKAYFRERGLRDEILRKFQLGYSPAEKNAFTKYAMEKGYEKETLEQSGLSIFRETLPEGLDRFRDRVIFPILSFSGRVLGFGGRILGNQVKTAKYINSPETEIYYKSHVLYGLYQSKQAISRKNNCLLVEGYMDVISLHQIGIEHVVASSGTALSIDQIKLIKRLTENVTLLFDGDAAGIKASFRSIDLLLAEGMNTRVLLFPDGEDPDSFSKKHSVDFVEKFIEENTQDFIEFKADILLKEAEGDPIKKAETIRDILKSVSFVSNVLKQEIYLQKLASKFEVSMSSLFSELGIQKQLTERASRKERIPTEEKKLELMREEKMEINELFLLEEKLVGLMLKYGDVILTRRNEKNDPYEITVIEEILAYLEQDSYEFLSDLNRKIVEEIKKGIENNELRSGDFFITFMDGRITEKIADVLISNHQLSEWSTRNIYPPNMGDKIAQQVEEDLLIHKYHYVVSIIENLDQSLDQIRDSESEENYWDSIKKIMRLKELLIKLNAKLNRNPVTKSLN